MSLDRTVSELREEIERLRSALFVAASAMLVFLTMLNLYAALNIGRMEKIFEDMLGSRDKLPQLTKLVIRYGRAADGWMPAAMTISFTAIAWSLMSMNRRSAKFMLVAVCAAFVLLAQWVVILLSLNMPMQQIITGLGSP